MQFITTTEIDAHPDVVFGVLSDIERWPEWTPTVTRVERLGDLGAPFALGTRLRIVQPRVPPAEWTVTASLGRAVEARFHPSSVAGFEVSTAAGPRCLLDFREVQHRLLHFEL